MSRMKGILERTKYAIEFAEAVVIYYGFTAYEFCGRVKDKLRKDSWDGRNDFDSDRELSRILEEIIM